MSGDRVSKVSAGPVCIRGIQVGEPLDVFFDSDLRCAIALEVLCRDGIHRFLPWAVGKSGPDGLSISFSAPACERTTPTRRGAGRRRCRVTKMFRPKIKREGGQLR